MDDEPDCVFNLKLSSFLSVCYRIFQCSYNISFRWYDASVNNNCCACQQHILWIHSGKRFDQPCDFSAVCVTYYDTEKDAVTARLTHCALFNSFRRLLVLLLVLWTNWIARWLHVPYKTRVGFARLHSRQWVIGKCARKHGDRCGDRAKAYALRSSLDWSNTQVVCRSAAQQVLRPFARNLCRDDVVGLSVRGWMQQQLTRWHRGTDRRSGRWRAGYWK